MKGSKSLIAISIAVTLAIIPSAIATPKTTLKAAGRVTTPVVNTILNGVGVPAKTIGIDGDFYIDTKNLNLYGPKIKGAWKIGTSLKQTEIKSVSTVIGEGGAVGEKGEKGDKGATGNTGATGSAGLIGIPGVAGVAGAKGSDGAPGAAGMTGATGLTGSAGVAGTAGSNGTNGAAGASGSQGIQGVKGDNGAQGIQGDQGVVGTQGIQGIKGDAGIAGSPGVTGPAGISNSKFGNVQNISLVTGSDGGFKTGTFFTADSDGNYTFEILVAGVVQTGVDYKLNAEIVIGASAITYQYVVASDAITFANNSAGRQYGFHIIGAAAGVSVGTIFAVRISIQSAVVGSNLLFTGRALINKVGTIG